MPYKASMEIDSMIYNLPVNNGNITFITSAVVIATDSGCCIQHTAVKPEIYQLPLDSTCHCYRTLTSGCHSTHLGAGLCPEQNNWAPGTAGAFGQTSRTFFRHKTINREKLLIQILYFKSSKCSTLKLKIQLWHMMLYPKSWKNKLKIRSSIVTLNYLDLLEFQGWRLCTFLSSGRTNDKVRNHSLYLWTVVQVVKINLVVKINYHYRSVHLFLTIIWLRPHINHHRKTSLSHCLKSQSVSNVNNQLILSCTVLTVPAH